MIDTHDLVRRAATIRLSRHPANIFDARCDYYVLADIPPNYPMPAIRQRNWVEIGYLSAMNGFNTDDAFVFIRRYF